MKKMAEQSSSSVAILYGRTGDPVVEALKDLLEEGRFGKLALYKQDWIHAYPQWNKWATDPEKNGGPFMDAMIHNLNLSNYLMDRPIENATFFSQNLSHPDLPCADTESMVVTYKENGMANLFITWAADLATYSTQGNDREHIDLFYLVTDQGWRITREDIDDVPYIKASREGKEELIDVKNGEASAYDQFADAVEQGNPIPRTFADLDQAVNDITLLRTLEKTATSGC